MKEEMQVETSGQFLTFMLKKQLYGAPIYSIREINRLSDITSVPKTHSYVAGVVNLRGKVIPVVDLCHKFGIGHAEKSKESCIIVVEGEKNVVGTIVDAVCGVVDLEKSKIEPCPSMGKGADLQFVLGMGKIDDKVIILVDIVKVMASEELNDLADLEQTLAKAS